MLIIVTYVLAVLGAISSVWFLFEKYQGTRRISWRDAERAANRIVKQMQVDGFNPTLIVAISRGGAVMGALVSGVLGHRPMLLVDAKYEWTDEGERRERMHFKLEDSYDEECVLLISGELHSGRTMRMYCDHFHKLGCKELKKATFYFERGSVYGVDYTGFESDRKMLRLPWMFAKEYKRLARTKE